MQKAIIQAFWYVHRIELIPIDAGCKTMRRGGTHGFSSIPEGFPDLIGIGKGGRFLAIEVKDKGKKPRKEQLAFLEKINSRCGIGFWADSVESALEQYDRFIADANG